MKNSIILNKNDTFQSQDFKSLTGEVSYASVKYPTHDCNQDSLAIFELDNGDLVLLVSDGMGGHASGEVASKIICDTFKKQLSKKTKKLRERVLDSIEKSNKEILKLKIGAGATLSCCSIEKKGKIRFYNIGDSSQFLLGSRGKIKFEGVEHSPLGHGIEAGLIENRVDQNMVESNIISNYVGSEAMRIEMSIALEISEGDIVILASDGIRDLMNREDYVQWAIKDEFKNRINGLTLKFESKAIPIEDDSTVILYRYSQTK